MRTVHRRDGCLDPKFRHVRTVEHQAAICDLQAARLVSGNIFSPCFSQAKRLAATGIERPELKRAPCGGSACPVALPLQQGRQRTSSRHKVRGTVEKTSRAALHGRHACQCTSPWERPHSEGQPVRDRAAQDRIRAGGRRHARGSDSTHAHPQACKALHDTIRHLPNRDSITPHTDMTLT